jgi:hypothetical protein
MITVLVILGFILAGMTISLIAAATAPVGYQDDTGFHYGPACSESSEEFTCTISETKLA